MGEQEVDSEQQTLCLLEALLFRAAEPVPESELAAVLSSSQSIAPMMRALVERYAERGIRVVRRGECWAMVSADELASKLKIVITEPRRLSRAAMETLAIVAYYQPLTRAEIEEIRGVTLSRTTLNQLLEAGWVASHGHRSVPGRPVVWGTTIAFLHHFGLESLHDLPLREDLADQGLITREAQPELFDFARLPEDSCPEEGVGADTESPAPSSPSQEELL
jgi:segregation and condensation protein B